MAEMSVKFSFFKTLFLFLYRVLFRQFKIIPKGLHRNVSNIHVNTHCKCQKFVSLLHRSDLSEKTLIFSVEGALLKSSSLFPYFFLVAFEAGGVLRALVLLLLYPLIYLVREEIGMKIMVMVCFFGIKKERFRVGRAVLPKFFLEDVGWEPFMVFKKGGKRIAVSNIPQVMIESFLRDYLEIDFVVGRELKVFHGYFLGLMEEKKESSVALEEILTITNESSINDLIGITRFNSSHLDKYFFSSCKEVYLVARSEKRIWSSLPRDMYPKPFIFHDGRVAPRPTPIAALTFFMWMPFGIILSIFRTIIALSFPFKLSTPILAYSGFVLRLTIKPTKPPYLHKKEQKQRGALYVCNHRTLLDPLYVSFSLQKDLTAVTYSLSRVSELLAPIRTVRLTRNRDIDAEKMGKLLNQGDLVVCPEGTTCREPYLLRFSPLFSEMSEEIVPVAVDARVSMFYGTTAGGLKCLDPFFFAMNPKPSYMVEILNPISGSSMCEGNSTSRYDVANHVQSELGKALGFECTKLTRRDKYLILAGNEGISCNNNKP
ncbi:hypothetical protein SLA2020_170710 [Shorea laevis]